MTSDKPSVAFIGLGAMGFGMATHLVKQGYSVKGFDVWQPTLDRFAAAGGSTAATPAEAVAGQAYCVVMVATAAQAQTCLIDGDAAALKSLQQGAVVLLCSTVPCAYVQGLAEQLVSLGRPDILLVDAPVSGGAQRAAEGQLSIMAGASKEALEAGKSVLAEMADSTKLYLVGGIGAGSNMKMCHQVLAAVQILAASEGMGFAAHLGLDGPATLDKLMKSSGASFMLGHRGPRMFTDFKPLASALTIIVKDTLIITSEARRSGYAVPVTAAAEAAYLTALNLGYGPEDDSALLKLYIGGIGKMGPVTCAAKTDEDKVNLVICLLQGIHLCAAAECLGFAHKVGLDLDQVLDLCINAAGGSAMLQAHGQAMIQALTGTTSTTKGKALSTVFKGLWSAVEEAAGLKVPLYLGNAALNVMQIALNSTERTAIGPVAAV